MRTRTRTTIGGAPLALGLLLGAVAPASASTPQVFTWTHHAVDPDYFECNGQPITGDWQTSHRLTVFFNANGTPQRDTEDMTYSGAFVNPANGLSIPDSGRSIFFDTLDASGNYLTTIVNSVRHSAYLHAAGRSDFQTGAHMGMDNWNAGVGAACAALGA